VWVWRAYTQKKREKLVEIPDYAIVVSQIEQLAPFLSWGRVHLETWKSNGTRTNIPPPTHVSQPPTNSHHPLAQLFFFKI
jgi:hypothetical protein